MLLRYSWMAVWISRYYLSELVHCQLNMAGVQAEPEVWALSPCLHALTSLLVSDRFLNTFLFIYICLFIYVVVSLGSFWSTGGLTLEEEKEGQWQLRS